MKTITMVRAGLCALLLTPAAAFCDTSATTQQAQPLTSKAIASMSPADLLSSVGKGIYFEHDFDKLGVAHPVSHCWWEKSSTLLTSSLKLVESRGDERVVITIHGYNGPGMYQRDDYEISLKRGDKIWTAVEGSAHSITVDEDADGWISGHFNALLSDGSTQEPRRISGGVFRVSHVKSDVAAVFED